MKKSLFLLLFSCMSLFVMQAQTITWTGAVDVNYSNPANWNPVQVPTAANDVIIPTGSTMTINVAATVKSIEVQGTSTIIMNQSLSFTNASSFSSNTTVNWNSGSFYGGGTLTNNGTVNLTSGGSRYISGATTLINNGLVTMPGGGYLYLYDTSILNNTSSGVFDIQSEATISYSGSGEHNFTNAGLLKKTTSTGNSSINCFLYNTGTISVENGTLTMNSKVKTFEGGIYNIATDGALILNTQIDVSNTLTGELNGPITWANNVSVAATATFDFTGNIGVNWTGNSLIGGGTLTNASTINLTTGGSRYISGATTLMNNGLVTMPGGGYFYLFDTSIFNNTSSGVFDLQSDVNISYSGNSHNFINAGILKKTGGTGTSRIATVLTNTGTISIESGTLTMDTQIKTFGGGIYNVSSGTALVVSTTGMNISGTLTGILDGPLVWTGHFSVADEA